MVTNHRSTTLDKILGSEATGGVLLMIMAVVAMFVVNIHNMEGFLTFLGADFQSWVAGAEWFKHLLHTEVTFGVTKTVHHWINDGVMTIFFFTIGLEVKREVCDESGKLNTLSKSILPIIAAVSGVVVPALIYTYFNGADVFAAKGWAVPTATDIAFALGVLMLVGKGRIPLSVKVFLLAVAVIDDLIAVAVIAAFYSGEINFIALGVGSIFMGLLFIQNRMNSNNIFFYLLWALGLWMCVLGSGIHATVAGVLAALMIPATAKLGNDWSLLKTAEHQLAPMNAWIVMPLFALANAGVDLAGVSLANLIEPVSMGVILALMLGKPLGIVGVTYLVTKFTNLKLPEGMTNKHLLGVGLLAGIGFTMSMFVTELAFVGHPELASAAKLAVLIASAFMGVIGFVYFKLTCPVQTDVVADEAEAVEASNAESLKNAA